MKCRPTVPVRSVAFVYHFYVEAQIVEMTGKVGEQNFKKIKSCCCRNDVVHVLRA